MAGQFDKFVKILGTGSRPDVYKGAPGNPDIVAPVEVKGSDKDPNGGGKQDKVSRPSAVPLDSRPGGNNTRKRKLEKLPATGADPTKTWKPSADPVPLPKKVETPAPTNQPYNLTTGAVKAQYNDPNSINSTTLSWDPKLNDAKETGVRHVAQQFEKVKKIKARKGGTVHGSKDVRDFETEHPDSPASSAATGKTISEANKRSRFTEPLAKPTKRTVVTEPARAVIEGDIAGAAYEQVPDPKRPGYSIEGPNVAAGYDDPNDLRSTTMREVPAEGPAAPVRHEKLPGKPIAAVPTRTPRQTAAYEKPEVTKPGNVIPQVAIDTFGSQPVDRKQAAKENKRLRQNRSVPVTTTVFDPNKISARPVRGQTPERQAVLGAIREGRVRELAGQKTPEGKPKEMTTVSPEVMDTAKRLGATDKYNLTEDYMNSTSFLSHEAIQKATVAHALGVHHTLAEPDEGHLGRYLGGRPLEAKALLANAFKVVDRNRRGNPEKVPGEFDILRASVHAGTTPSRMLNNLRSGKPTNAIVNGQSVTMAPGSSYNRSTTHAKASEITAETESAPKIARGSVAATPTAPLAGTNRVAVRSIGQAPEEAKIREFSPQELRNKGNVPTVDDSKSKMGPAGEEVAPDTSDIVERLKVGKRDKAAVEKA